MAFDQCIELTVNRDSKSSGGIIGFSLNPSAVHRWIATAHERASIVAVCREFALVKNSDSAGGQQAELKPKEMSKARLKKDEEDVCSLTTTIEAWLNPFSDTRDSIVNMASGATVSDDIKRDLLAAHDIGEAAMKKFVSERLETDSTPFHDPIVRQKLKTFSSLV